jgi:hypothetical protein
MLGKALRARLQRAEHIEVLGRREEVQDPIPCGFEQARGQVARGGLRPLAQPPRDFLHRRHQSPSARLRDVSSPYRRERLAEQVVGLVEQQSSLAICLPEAGAVWVFAAIVL